MSQDNNLLEVLLVKQFILTINHMSLKWVHSAWETAEMWLPHGRAKGVTEKEHVDEVHHSHASPNRPVFRLHSLQVFASEMKGRWSRHHQHLSETPSFHERWERRHLGNLCAKGNFWHLRDAVPVIRMDRSVYPVNLGKHGPGSCSSVKLVLLSWSMKVCGERGFVSCAPSNLPPLHFPSLYELKRVHKNIPLLVIIHSSCVHPFIMMNFLLHSFSSLLSSPTKGKFFGWLFY